ncbi:MAG: hypothetical protein AAFX99_15440, partial [Myxococcota bacterium]
MMNTMRWIGCALVLCGVACTGPKELPDPTPPPPPPVAKPEPKPTPKPPEPPPEPRPPACPDGMVFVETDYCTQVVDTCLEETTMGYPRGCMEFST